MDKETVLKHSKSIRLYNKVENDFIVLLEDFCKKKDKPEHLQKLIQLLNIPMIGQEVINFILEEYEKEHNIIKLGKLNSNKIIDIW